MKGTEQEVRGEFPTVAGSSPYCTVRNTRENESAVCHYISHLRHLWPESSGHFFITQYSCEANEAELLLAFWAHSQACPQPGTLLALGIQMGLTSTPV